MLMAVFAVAMGAAHGASGFDVDHPWRLEAPRTAVSEHVPGVYWIEAENFADYGGWVLDTQFAHKMGSGYLLAPGVGKPSAVAVTRICVATGGTYRVWVRTKDWVPEHHPGRFALEIGGRRLEKTLGASGRDWSWEDAGTLEIPCGEVELRLVDLSGFYARCDAVVLSRDGAFVPSDGGEELERQRDRCTGVPVGMADGGAYDLVVVGGGPAGTPTAHPHPKTLTYSHIVPGMWYSVSATNAAALCMRWLRDAFYAVGRWQMVDGSSNPAGSTSYQLPTTNLYQTMDEEAQSSPIGANGVFFHPYLQGERCPYWDSNLRASFTGVSISSTRGDFCRALMEGVAFSLRDCYRTLEEMRLPVKRIFLIGGGARSGLWSEIVCNVFNRPVAVPTPGDASFGACLLAGTGIGLFADVKDAVAKCLHVDRTIEPDAKAALEYDHLFACYRKIHDALAPVYKARVEK